MNNETEDDILFLEEQIEWWRLERFAYLPAGTLGILRRPEGAPQVAVLERPWRNNAPFESCIPEGSYRLRSFSGRRWKGSIEVTEIPDRTVILFHPGNSVSDLAGCLAPGMQWNINNGEPKVMQSRMAYEMLIEDFYHEDDTFSGQQKPPPREVWLSITSIKADWPQSS